MADFEVNKRLRYLITDVFNTTPFAFSKKYDDLRGVKTSRIINQRNGVSSNMVDIICTAYPDINRTWLLTGEGEPLKKNIEKEITEKVDSEENITMSREVFDLLRLHTETILSQQRTIEILSLKSNNHEN